MSYVFWQIIGIILIVLGTIIGGVASYLSNKDSKSTIANLISTDKELKYATTPEEISIRSLNADLSQFKKVLKTGKKSTELLAFFPRAYHYNLTDEDFDEIIEDLILLEEKKKMPALEVLMLITEKNPKKVANDARLSTLISKYYPALCMPPNDTDIGFLNTFLKGTYKTYANKKDKDSLLALQMVITIPGERTESPISYLLSEFPSTDDQNVIKSLEVNN